MGLGYRGEGIFHSAPMAADTTITKGEAVAFDGSGNLVTAPTSETNPVGVAAETKTSEAGETPELAYVKHGIAEVTADGAISAGDAVIVSANTAGHVATHDGTAVDEGGTATHTVEPFLVLGQALEDIADDATGDIFVGGGAGVA